MADFGKHLADRLAQANPEKVPNAVGISWYTRKTYQECMAIFDDRRDMPADYDEWLARAMQAEQDTQRQGLKVVRVLIDPVTFPKWCSENGFARIDKQARMAYGNQATLEWLRKSLGESSDSSAST